MADRIRAARVVVCSPGRNFVTLVIETEQGLTGMDSRVWFGLLAPTGTPRDAVEKVQRTVAKILTAPAFVEKNLVQQAFDPIASTPEEFARTLKVDREAGAELIRISGAKLE